MDDDDDLWAVSVSTSARVDESEPSSSTVAALATTPENTALTVTRPLAARNDDTTPIPRIGADDNIRVKPHVVSKAAHCNPHLPQLPSATPEVVDMLIKTALPKGEARLHSLSRILKRPPLDDRPSMAKAESPTRNVISEKRKRKPYKERGPIARINVGAFSGPLRRLCDYVQRKCRVRVLVRSLSGVRSELLATVVAFDKHWNLVLVDVDELYMRPKARRVFRQGRHEGEVASVMCYKSVDKGYKRTKELMSRHCKQLLLNGDHVIAIHHCCLDMQH